MVAKENAAQEERRGHAVWKVSLGFDEVALVEPVACEVLDCGLKTFSITRVERYGPRVTRTTVYNNQRHIGVAFEVCLGLIGHPCGRSRKRELLLRHDSISPIIKSKNKLQQVT